MTKTRVLERDGDLCTSMSYYKIYKHKIYNKIIIVVVATFFVNNAPWITEARSIVTIVNDLVLASIKVSTGSSASTKK